MVVQDFADVEGIDFGCNSTDESSERSEATAVPTRSCMMSDEEMNAILTLHYQLFTNLTATSWHCVKPSRLPKLSLLQPLLLRYRILCDVIKRCGNVLGSTIYNDTLAQLDRLASFVRLVTLLLQSVWS